MKSVMLSIKPKYCRLIARGEKNIEVRKTRKQDRRLKRLLSVIYIAPKKSIMVDFYILQIKTDIYFFGLTKTIVRLSVSLRT